jgi:CRISPR-associated protein Cmr3
VFVPAPRDALVLGEEGAREIHRLRPLAAPDGALFDDGAPAVLVGLDEGAEGKVPSDLPAWWRWASFARWLAGDGATAKELLDGALRPLPREHRMHVKLGPEGVAQDAMLFETAGLRFVDARSRDLAMLVDVTCGQGQTLRAGAGPFAGERRIVQWREARGGLPEMPAAVRAHLARPDRVVRVRVVLLTSASFFAGSTPSFATGSVLGERDGVTVRAVAAIAPRPETISGWDFARGEPKPTRRLVAAGSVLWLDLDGTPEARLAWAKGVWMQNVSDDDQSRRDGFGLAALGVA